MRQGCTKEGKSCEYGAYNKCCSPARCEYTDPSSTTSKAAVCKKFVFIKNKLFRKFPVNVLKISYTTTIVV